MASPERTGIGSPIRIHTQQAMREARTRIGFCYLCGEALPQRGIPGSKKQILGEHVIPRALLGPPPREQGSRWAVELDVHRACEQSTKQSVDHWLKLLQDMHVKRPTEWPNVGHMRAMPARPGFIDGGKLGPLPAITGLSELFDGVRHWIRGIHATLYTEFLPTGQVQLVLPPVPALSGKARGMSLDETEQSSTWIRAILDLGLKRNKWDGVSAWGSAIAYKCVWWQCTKTETSQSWLCSWTLSLPGLMDWSTHVLPAGQDRPWHGHYVCASPPKRASVLVSEDFPSG